MNNKIRRKESVGVTIFGIFFVVIGFYLLLFFFETLKIYFPQSKMLVYAYNLAEQQLIGLDKYAKENISDEVKLKEFTQKKEAFAEKLKSFKKRYLSNIILPLSKTFLIVFSFLASLSYIITGFLILRIYKYSYRYILFSIIFGFFLLGFFLMSTYELLKTVNFFTKNIVDLSNLVSDAQKTVEFKSPLELMFFGSEGFALFFVVFFYIIFVISTIIFFNRKTTKIQFQSNA